MTDPTTIALARETLLRHARWARYTEVRRAYSDASLHALTDEARDIRRSAELAGEWEPPYPPHISDDEAAIARALLEAQEENERLRAIIRDDHVALGASVGITEDDCVCDVCLRPVAPSEKEGR